MKRWEAFGGITSDVVGVRRSGRPHAVLMTTIIVVFSAADAKAMTKKYPQLKFKERTGYESAPSEGTDR